MPTLTALKVKNAKPGRYADGRGLYLLVRESGSRSWVLRTQTDGKRQDFGLGSASSVSLAQARAKAAGLRDKVKAGEPITAQAVVPKPTVPTFEAAAQKCHEALKSGWANGKHRDGWLASLENHVFPMLGEIPIDEINSLVVRDALAPIWLVIPETARRILQRIGVTLDFAHIQGWRPEETSLRSVRRGLPRQPSEESHFEAMSYEEVPAFVARLLSLPETAGRDALLFTILNACRSGETRLSVWPEFDITTTLWSVPAKRMKMKKAHMVPLAPASIAILKRRWSLRADDEGFVFSTHGTKPLSDMTLTKVLRDLGYSAITVHRFRSSFTDWAAEKTSFPKEVVDKALAHKLPDRVEAAYRRTDFLERRRKLMAAWAKFLIP
ncbi:MAG TPA: integrase arm-type DNA-binding domain-containing protein [Sphingomonas sp.]|nr:integrase arm-type DNA-binding domain-containing protein [Sphingomonas sp.]